MNVKKSFKAIQVIVCLLTVVAITFAANTVAGQHLNNSTAMQTDSAIVQGKWDMTIDVDGKMSPSWFEIHHSGLRTLVGQFVGMGGSARPVARMNFTDKKLSFSLPPQWEQEPTDIMVEGTLDGQVLSGVITMGNGKTYKWTANKAPLLKRQSPPVWGTPVRLFDGSNISQWHPSGAVNQWVPKNGIMQSPKSGSNLITNEVFKDFKLHIEFRYPAESNSGVYLRGRYEVQVMDSKGAEPASVLFGGIYGFISPSEMAAKAAGEWQAFDITLIGRLVTVVANGKTIICNQEIPGITGGAIDSNEGAPGPIMLQGDHGPVDYRNITITPSR